MQGMPGMGIETSLIETTTTLLTMLAVLVGVAVVAGILTLPIFYGVLSYIVSWFWSGDSPQGSVFKRGFAAGLRVTAPLLSLGATLLSLGYFGAFDWPYRLATNLPATKMGPTQSAVKTQFDGVTRQMFEKAMPVLRQDAKIDWKRCPAKAKELIEIWDNAMKPPVNPLDAAFPPYTNPPAENPMAGPPPTPPIITLKVKELLAAHENGSLYEGADTGVEITREEIRAAEDFFDRGLKASKANQDKMVQGFRGVSLYFLILVGPIPLVVFIASVFFGKRMITLILRSLIRGLLRTSLTYLAVFVLVFVLCCVWSVLAFLQEITAQKDTNLKGIITEKFQIPSQMKPSHLETVKALIAELPPGQRPDNVEDNIMTWAFVGGTLDPKKRTPQNSLFFFATEPEKVMKMMPGMEDLTGEERDMLEKAVEAMAKDKQACVIGADKLRQMGKRVGDRMKMTSLNYRGIDFDFVIIAEFPSGSRWEQSAVMNRRYLDEAVTNFRGEGATANGHPLADKCMNLIWVRLPSPQAFDTLSAKLNDPGKFSPAIKMEIESSAYANFLSPFKTLLWFMKWPLSLGLLAIITLVTSLVIGIGVRERKTEIAVLKVLGFRPKMVLGLVLGEALLVGVLSGFLATATAFSMVNALGGLSLGIAFFNKFFVPENALWWGVVIGGLTSLFGAILPSVSSYRIKASQVFSRVT